jgi:hypothetical protein
VVGGKKQFVFQFENVKSLGVAEVSTFQTVLTEDGEIFFYYKEIRSLGSGNMIIGLCDRMGKSPITIPLFGTPGVYKEIGIQVFTVAQAETTPAPQPEPEPDPAETPEDPGEVPCQDCNEAPCQDCADASGEILTIEVKEGIRQIILKLPTCTSSKPVTPFG